METVGTQNALQGAGREVFALTDEQILGISDREAEGGDERAATGDREAIQDAVNLPRSLHSEPLKARLSGRDDNSAKGTENGWKFSESGTECAENGRSPDGGTPGAQTRVFVPQEPPRWLAERMRDPWHGDEAKELWDGAVLARQEAAAYREALGTPEEARALKEIYPGGVNEAKTAAERARQLEEFDAAYFGATGRLAEELSAARVQLAQRLMEQDPGAFREMVAAGVRLLEGRSGKEVASGPPPLTLRRASEWRVARKESGDLRPETGDQETAREVGNLPRSLRSEPQTARLSGRDDNRSEDIGRDSGVTDGLPEGIPRAQSRVTVPPEVADRYVAFEKTANAELEKSVGGAIARAMESALPNLKSLDRAGRDAAGQGTPLPERLGAAVREEVEAALKSDAQLGEQVARILGARRFDDAVRAQVVRVIDARAQQLVPGAVKRVVGSWTTATLGARGKSRAAEAETGSESRVNVAARPGKNGQSAGRNEKTEMRAPGRTASRGRVDYGKLSDEQILDMS